MAEPSDISRKPRRAVAPTIVDVAATLADLDAASPVLSGADLPFTGDGDRAFVLHTADIIGAGGQGAVVRATDKEGNIFAAKIAYQPHAVRDRLARRVILGYLRGLMADHPLGERHFTETHLMPLYATGTVSDCTPGLGETTYDVAVMPLCDDRLARAPGADYELLRDTVIPQAACALHLLHEQGIVHRDVKPKNLYLLDGTVVLGDFGISSVLEEGRDTSATKVDRRTPGYSPHSSVVQRENDWYALGYTIWTLYNGGVHPHQALIDADDLSAVLAGGRPVPFRPQNPAHASLGDLIYGLTYAHAQGRLGYDDIQRWLADPAAFRYRDPMAGGMAGVAGYQFEGTLYESRSTLVTALASNWEKARRHLYTHGLEDYFRKIGETDLAVALNDLTDRDPDTAPDDAGGNEDLGLSRALALIDPAREAVFWKGSAVLRGTAGVDALFRQVTATPLGFYRIAENDEAARDMLGIVAVAGFPAPAQVGLAWLREHPQANLSARVDRLLEVLEATAGDAAAVRAFAVRYGSDGWARWVQENLRLYHGRDNDGDRLIQAVAAAKVPESSSLAASAEARGERVRRAEDLAARTEASPHLRHMGIVRANETAAPATAGGYFTAELFGRPVPRGFIAHLMEASAGDAAAVAWARDVCWGARSRACAEDARAALEDVATQIDALADAEGKHALVDGLSKPAFFSRLAVAVAFVLLACFVIPRFTFGMWREGVINAGEPLITASTVLISPTGLGEGAVYPSALIDVAAVPTATFTGVILLGFLAAASAVLAPKLASALFVVRGVGTKGRTRRRATALRKEAEAIASGTGAAEGWISGDEEGAVPVARDTSVFIAKTRARRHPETTATALSKVLFWGGAAVAAAGITALMAPGIGYESWASLASETGWPFLESQLAWGIGFCGLAVASFAIVAVFRRAHPTMVTLTLLCFACVLPYLAVGAGFIGIVLFVLYLVFSIIRR